LKDGASIHKEKPGGHAQLTRGSALTLRKILSDGRLEFLDRKFLRKLVFFFGDSIGEDDEGLYDGKYEWLC